MPDGKCIDYIEGYTKEDKDTIYRIEYLYDEGLLSDIKGCNFLFLNEENEIIDKDTFLKTAGINWSIKPVSYTMFQIIDDLNYDMVLWSSSYEYKDLYDPKFIKKLRRQIRKQNRAKG